MEVTLRIPDEVAKRLSADGSDVSRRALEALALQGYRDRTLTLFQVSEMLGLSRVETTDFLGQHNGHFFAFFRPPAGGKRPPLASFETDRSE